MGIMRGLGFVTHMARSRRRIIITNRSLMRAGGSCPVHLVNHIDQFTIVLMDIPIGEE